MNQENGIKPLDKWTWEIPERFNIGVACSDRHLEGGRDRTAMIVEDAERGTTETTYGELALLTDWFAQLLRNLDVDVGERVLIRLPNSLHYPIAFLGTMKRGAVSTPTSTLLVAEEVRYLAQDSEAAVLVTDKSMWPELESSLSDLDSIRYILLAGDGPMPTSADARVLDLDAYMAAIHEVEPPEPTRADDPAYLVYTSGTTGHPKGVLHAHRSLLGRLPASSYWFDFADEDRILHSGKFNWTYVLGSGLMDPLYNGKTVVVYEGPNNPTVWPELLAKHSCTIFIGVPTIYRQIIQKTTYAATDLPALRHCMSAGEHLCDEMLAAWRDRFGMDVYEAIGMSEISYYLSQTVSRPIRAGSAGFPQPGHQVRLLDADLVEAGVDEEGMICMPLDDPGLFLRYWNRPEETAQCQHNGWFFTGDYARRDKDGYIWFMGRRDDIINTFGYRVSPHEVERVMKNHPGVADCVAIGEEIATNKTLVAACVILHPQAKITADDLLDFGEQHLAGYKRPKMVHVLQEFPRTKNGKVIRSRLKLEIEARKAS